MEVTERLGSYQFTYRAKTPEAIVALMRAVDEFVAGRQAKAKPRDYPCVCAEVHRAARTAPESQVEMNP